MTPTENRSQIEVRKIVIFGAGKIGALLLASYLDVAVIKLFLIDVDPIIVTMLNQRGN